MNAVDIVVPTWNGEGHIEECLRSALDQTHRELRIMVGDDASTDATVDLVRQMARSDSRVNVVDSPVRNGWIRNTNRLLELVEAPWFVILPHDDVLDPVYVERLLGLLRSDSEAICAFSDIIGFGSKATTVATEPWVGDAAARIEAFIGCAPNGVSWRGVTARSVLDAGLRLREGVTRGFHADTVYVAELLSFGPVLRCAEPLYRKRYAAGSVMSTRWLTLAGPDEWVAFAEHSVQLLQVVAAVGADSQAVRRLLSVTLDRLILVLRFDTDVADRAARRAAFAQAAESARQMWRGLGSERWIESRYAHVDALEGGRANVEAHLRAVRLDPSNGSARTSLARALLTHDRVGRAWSHARRAARAQPWNPWAWAFAAEVALRRGSDRRAEECARRVMGLIPHTDHGPNQLSRVFETKGDIDRSIEFARMAASLQPESSTAQARLARLGDLYASDPRRTGDQL